MRPIDRHFVSQLAPALKRRNAALDATFYDIGALTRDDYDCLSPINDPEGAIVVVPPSSSGRGIRHYADAAEFLKKERSTIRALAVAGVGSSALGTAALARNIADVYGFDVAGIVSGYGAIDLATEALGGWFLYGMVDRAMHDMRNMFGKAAFNKMREQPGTSDQVDGYPFAKDISTLEEILAAAPPQLCLAVGHSKGALLLDFALEHFVRTTPKTDHPYFRNLRLVTLGTVTDLPKEFGHIHQFIGKFDWFGGINSRSGVPHTSIPNAWHHLNPTFCFHMDVGNILRTYVSI